MGACCGRQTGARPRVKPEGRPSPGPAPATVESAVSTKSPEYGVVAPDVLLSFDGLSFLQALIDGPLPAPPIMRTLGFRLAAVEHGRAVFEGEPRMEYYNPIGTVHGGYAATLLDSAVACAIHTTLAKGEAYTTLEL